MLGRSVIIKIKKQDVKPVILKPWLQPFKCSCTAHLQFCPQILGQFFPQVFVSCAGSQLQEGQVVPGWLAGGPPAPAPPSPQVCGTPSLLRRKLSPSGSVLSKVY